MNLEELKEQPLNKGVYFDPADYRIAKCYTLPTGKRGRGYSLEDQYIIWNVFDPNSLVYSASTESQCIAWVEKRCNPPELANPVVFSDICRCGALRHQWQHVRTGDIVWQLCNLCGRPLRHDVMLALNKDKLKDFDLDEFLNL